MTEVASITTLDILKNPISFILKHIPNQDEITINIINKPTMDMFLGKFSLMFGNNPTAKTVYRDMLKIPVSYNLIGTQIGNTDYYHDEGGVYAATWKAFCKGTILITYKSNHPTLKNYYYSDIDENEALALAARFGNYFCEAPARFLNIISKERQLMIKKSPSSSHNKTYYEFAREDSKVSWYFEAIVSGFFKTTTSDQVGEMIKKNGYATNIRSFINVADDMILYQLHSKQSSESDVAQDNEIVPYKSLDEKHPLDNILKLTQNIREATSLIDNLILWYLNSGAILPFDAKDDIWDKYYKIAHNFEFNFYDLNLYYTCLSITVVDWTGYATIDLIDSLILITSTKIAQDFTEIVMRDLNDLGSYIFITSTKIAQDFIKTPISDLNDLGSYIFISSTKIAQDFTEILMGDLNDSDHNETKEVAQNITLDRAEDIIDIIGQD